MRRFLIFLAVLAVALGGVYVWWQLEARAVITGQVQTLARNFFTNATDLKVEVAPVKMTGLRQARVPKLVIAGSGLTVRGGGKIAHAKLVLTDLDVAGPPFHFIGVGGGYYAVTVTDTDVTQYLRKRGVGLRALVRIPLETVRVAFSRKTGTTLKGDVMVNLGLLKKRVPLTATGKLVPSSKIGQVDFQVNKVSLLGWSIGIKQVTDALGLLNPVVDVSDWPLLSEITTVKTGNGTVEFRGKITGVRPSLL